MLCGSEGLWVFVLVVRGGYLRLVHTIHMFEGGFHEECEFDGKFIAGVGDRTPTKNPTIIQLDDVD